MSEEAGWHSGAAHPAGGPSAWALSPVQIPSLLPQTQYVTLNTQPQNSYRGLTDAEYELVLVLWLLGVWEKVFQGW